jgi:hypothetical protein
MTEQAPNGSPAPEPPAAGSAEAPVPVVDMAARMVHLQVTFADGVRLCNVPFTDWKMLTAEILENEARQEVHVRAQLAAQQAHQQSAIVRAPSNSIIPEAIRRKFRKP